MPNQLQPGVVVPDATQIEFDGKKLLAVADSGWDAMEKGARPRAAGARIISIPLSPNCEPL